jgi:hypothetical protein
MTGRKAEKAARASAWVALPWTAAPKAKRAGEAIAPVAAVVAVVAVDVIVGDVKASKALHALPARWSFHAIRVAAETVSPAAELPALPVLDPQAAVNPAVPLPGVAAWAAAAEIIPRPRRHKP